MQFLKSIGSGFIPGLLFLSLVAVSCGGPKSAQSTGTVLTPVEEQPPTVEIEPDPVETTEEVIMTPVDSLIQPVDPKAGQKMQIALMLPFALDQKSLHTLEKKDAQKRNRPFVGLSFYEGALIALDTLKSRGVQLELFVYDTKNSADEVRRITSKPEFREIDLIIGPVFEQEVAQAAEFARNSKIPIVSPFLNPKNIADDATFYATNPGDALLCRKLAEYARVYHRSAEYYIIRRDNADEAEAAAQIKAGLGSVLGGDSLKEIITDFKLTGVPDTLHSVLPSVFFVPSKDEIFVTAAARGLATLGAEQDVTVFGLESWRRFQNIPPDYFNKVTLHFASSFWIDQYSENNPFESTFRRKYAVPPNEYAYKGYDIMLYFGTLVHKYGDNFSKELLNHPSFRSMQNRFMYRPAHIIAAGEVIPDENMPRSKSYVNQHAYIVQYSDYRFEVVR